MRELVFDWSGGFSERMRHLDASFHARSKFSAHNASSALHTLSSTGNLMNINSKLYFMNFNVVGRDHQHHWHHISFIKHHLTNSLHCCPSGALIFLCKAETFPPASSLVVELRSLRNCFHLLIPKLFKFSPHHLPCQHQSRKINLICRSSCPHPHSARLFNKSNLH